jgi:uncharacterized RDD family membrane protein YckC/Tfp pilus assembly major pilin PilA
VSDVAGIADDRAAYAGFWRRFAAWAVDYVVILIGSIVLRAVAPLVGIAGDTPRLTLVVIAGYFLYCALLESSPWQATLGKRALGLKVTNRRGERIGFVRAAARFVVKLLSFLTMFLGYLLVFVTRRRQALHDLIAGTLVANGGAKRPAWVVAPLAVVGSVPFVAVLAAIALPAYQDMTLRAQVSEGLTLASSHKAAIEAAWRNSQRDFARVSSASLGAGLSERGRYVDSIEVVSGIIVITYGAAANDALAGSVLALVPALDGNGALGWACGYGRPPAGFEVAFENHGGYTTIDERYVPSACRSSVP